MSPWWGLDAHLLKPEPLPLLPKVKMHVILLKLYTCLFEKFDPIIGIKDPKLVERDLLEMNILQTDWGHVFTRPPPSSTLVIVVGAWLKDMVYIDYPD